MIKNSRRHFFKSLFLAGASTLISKQGQAQSTCASQPSPFAGIGPFYPGDNAFTFQNDLTQVSGRPPAKGQIIYVRGRVIDSECRPVSRALVRLHHADKNGRYNGPGQQQENPIPLDPQFKYFGMHETDDLGRYSFKSIMPAGYIGDVGWMRPPHLHFHITRIGYYDLSTMMFFKGHPLNEADRIYKYIPAEQRLSVSIAPQGPTSGDAPGSLVYNFDMTMAPYG